MTEQHYVKCPNCDLEGVAFWGVGEFGSCAVCQGVGFVAVDQPAVGKIGKLQPRIALKDVEDVDATGEDRERAARAAFDAFYAEGTPYSEIERAMFRQVVDAVLAAVSGEPGE